MDKVPGPLVVSQYVLTELDYLLRTKVSVEAEVGMLGDLQAGAYETAELAATEIASAISLIERYASRNLGIADAANVVLAARFPDEPSTDPGSTGLPRRPPALGRSLHFAARGLPLAAGTTCRPVRARPAGEATRWGGFGMSEAPSLVFCAVSRVPERPPHALRNASSARSLAQVPHPRRRLITSSCQLAARRRSSRSLASASTVRAMRARSRGSCSAASAHWRM